MKRRRAVVASVIAWGAAAVSVCAQGGMGPGGGGMGGGGMTGDGSGLSTFETADFTGSGNCSLCHGNLIDSTGADVSIDTHWRSTMMANAAKDPLWQAKVDSEVLRTPAISSIIQEKCSRCHTPMARVQATVDGSPVSLLGDGFFSPSSYLHEAAMDGVSCALCHQIQADGLGSPATFTGQYPIDTTTAAPDRIMFGQYANPLANPMQMHVGFTPEYGSHSLDSALCGTCHTLFTPIIRGDGSYGGEFPEQMTYPEWEHAAPAGGSKPTCQDCHLPPAAGTVAISNRPWWLEPRSGFGMHHFVGGNSYMLQILKARTTDLGVTADATELDATLDRTLADLGTRAATISIPAVQVSSGILTAVVKVANLTGHKLPSGVPLRRAWIHLKVADRKGKVVFESGAPALDGTIAGNDADTSPGAYEPHYDLIGAPGEVQIYESIMGDATGNVTFTFLRAEGYLKDNRLLPDGFDKTTATLEIAVHGGAELDPSFTGGTDEVTYRIPVGARAGRLTITARLLYQSVSRRFVEDLRPDAALSGLVDRFIGYDDAADRTPVVLATAQKRT